MTATDPIVPPFRRKRLFISGRGDQTHIAALADLLRVDYDVWVDPHPYSDGAHELRVAEQLAGADVVLALLTPETVASPDCTEERRLAVQLGKPVVPVRFDPAFDLKAMPGDLRLHTVLDYTAQSAAQHKQLEAHLNGLTLPPGPVTPPPLPPVPVAPQLAGPPAAPTSQAVVPTRAQNLLQQLRAIAPSQLQPWLEGWRYNLIMLMLAVVGIGIAVWTALGGPFWPRAPESIAPPVSVAPGTLNILVDHHGAQDLGVVVVGHSDLNGVALAYVAAGTPAADVLTERFVPLAEADGQARAGTCLWYTTGTAERPPFDGCERVARVQLQPEQAFWYDAERQRVRDLLLRQGTVSLGLCGATAVPCDYQRQR